MICFFSTFSNNIGLLQNWVAGQTMGASSGHHILSLHRKVGSVFNEQDNLKNFLSKTNLLKYSNGKHLYLGIWQHSKYFSAAFFKELALMTIREMWGLEYRSRTSRSRLLWKSLGLEVWTRSRSRRLRSRLHHCALRSGVIVTWRVFSIWRHWSGLRIHWYSMRVTGNITMRNKRNWYTCVVVLRFTVWWVRRIERANMHTVALVSTAINRFYNVRMRANAAHNGASSPPVPRGVLKINMLVSMQCFEGSGVTVITLLGLVPASETLADIQGGTRLQKRWQFRMCKMAKHNLGRAAIDILAGAIAHFKQSYELVRVVMWGAFEHILDALHSSLGLAIGELVSRGRSTVNYT